MPSYRTSWCLCLAGLGLLLSVAGASAQALRLDAKPGSAARSPGSLVYVQEGPDDAIETAPAPTPVPTDGPPPMIDAAVRMGLVQLASVSGAYTGTLQPSCSGGECLLIPPQNCQERWMGVRMHLSDQAVLLHSDFHNMYCSSNVLGLALAVGVAAPLANTRADDSFRTWYRGHLHNDGAGNVARRFGEYSIAIPVVVAAAVGGRFFPEHACTSTIGDWGDRSVRALVVGAPAVVALQFGLGTDRPGSSYTNLNGTGWNPGHGREAVAGEAFVGAVPFLAAASMTKNRPLRWALIGGSFIATYAEINNDSHYLSQSLLGWSLAALATISVNQTENAVHMQVQPIALPQGLGMGVRFEY